MKQQEQIKCLITGAFRAIKKYTSAVAIVALLLCNTQAICQEKVYIEQGVIGVSVNSQLTANGYGVQYLPGVYYRKGRSTFSAAPVIQRMKSNFSGVQGNYEYSLTGSYMDGDQSCSAELFAFMNASYYHNALMGKITSSVEKSTNPLYEQNNMSMLRFKSVEAYAGFGIRVPFLKRFRWVSSIGAGYFHTLELPDNLCSYESCDIGLTLKTGISMELKKLYNKNKFYVIKKNIRSREIVKW